MLAGALSSRVELDSGSELETEDGELVSDLELGDGASRCSRV